MKQCQFLHTALDGNPYCVINGAMAPVALRCELIWRVLRIMNEKISAIT